MVGSMLRPRAWKRKLSPAATNSSAMAPNACDCVRSSIMKVQRHLDGARIRHKLELVTRHRAHGFLQKIDRALQTSRAVEWREAASKQLADSERERHAGYLVAFAMLQNKNSAELRLPGGGECGLTMPWGAVHPQ